MQVNYYLSIKFLIAQYEDYTFKLEQLEKGNVSILYGCHNMDGVISKVFIPANDLGNISEEQLMRNMLTTYYKSQIEELECIFNACYDKAIASCLIDKSFVAFKNGEENNNEQQ